MSKIKVILLSCLGAIAVQPFVFLTWLAVPMFLHGEISQLSDVVMFSPMTALFALPFVLLIGTPAALLLARYGKLRWLPLALIGFIAAALPVAVSGPGTDPGFSSGGNWHGKRVDFVVNGDPTLYGWLNHIESTLYFGLHGLIGATVFYWVWRRSMGPNNSFKPKPLRGSA